MWEPDRRDEGSRLRLYRVEREMSGDYFCTAVNGVGDNARDKIVLVVQRELGNRITDQ